jgi:hypothetical protein
MIPLKCGSGHNQVETSSLDSVNWSNHFHNKEIPENVKLTLRRMANEGMVMANEQ